MSHQTGIKASKELLDFLSEVKNGNTRVVKVGIENEELVVVDHKDAVGTWDEDYDSFVLAMVEERQPCYLFYRLDSQNNQGYEWLFISFSPDHAPTRQKMLYAGTRSTMKMEFGGGHILEELFTTLKEEISFSGYMKHKDLKNAAAPLTDAEVELKAVNHQHIHAAVNTKSSTLPGVSFPMSDPAIDALVSIAKKEVSYVQLSIDIKNEIINLEKSEDIEASQLASEIPADTPRYHFFLFKHTHEGDYLESIVFIYSMPGYTCSVKERMLYSSCKATLLSACEDVLNMTIDKKLEISEGCEVTEACLQEELHPQKNVHRQKFAKPKPPGARGGRRLLKTSDPE